MNEWIKESEKLKAENERLKSTLEESDRLIASLLYERNFYRDELARRGGNN